MHRLGRGAALALFLFATPGVRAAGEFNQRVRPFLDRYCVACHNAKLKTAGVSLDGVADPRASETWEKVVRKLRTGEMPPGGLPRAPQQTVASLVEWVTAELDRAATARPEPGRVPIHRLNRAEYNNAVRDLLAVDFYPAADFPADDSGYGFDNIAGVLSLPPVLMEKYLAAAGKVSRTALGRVRLDPVLERFNAPRNVPQDARLGAGAPVSSRGGIGIEHRFPADAEYVLRVRLRGAPDPRAPEIVDYRLDGKLLKRIEAAFGTKEEDEEQRRFELRVPVAAGRHRVLVTFLRDDSINESPHFDYSPSGAVRRNRLGVDWIEIGGPFNVKGPGDTESRRRILTCATDDEACAGQILGKLARRAWRRPVTAQETARLAGFYRIGRQDSGEFEGGIELGLKAILVSPHFLFRIERDPPGGGVYELGALELASRLSFFLWSSIPDEELLSSAESGALKKPEVFETQVRRMLRDPRAHALTENFAGQWLHLRNLDSLKPDPERFPEFDAGLREAMRREAEMFFDAVVREDRSVLDFLDARYMFVNDRLAKYYGVPGVEGREFQRVAITDGSRGGVLGMAGVLAVTSYPTRTSPVIRGKWVLENLLGAPPPPPPPEVPPLEEKAIGKTLTMRQQIEQHRANASCAACHAKMDPIGFALENYDAIGRFRKTDGAFEIDASGKLPSGAAFRDAQDLKRLLREHPEEFVLCFTEKLLTYALGRGAEHTDKPAVRAIARAAAKDDYTFSSIVLGIARSVPFRMRRAAREGLHAAD